MSAISLDLYLGFVAAAAALIAMPGPNTTLIVGNAIAYGTSKGLATLAGTSSALVIQLVVIGFGLDETAQMMTTWFDRLRWLGVAYLVWLGLREWLAKPDTKTAGAPVTVRGASLYGRGLLVCLSNPKTLAFFAAFLPQFIDRSRPVGPQLLVLSVTFMVLAILGDGAMCLLAGRIRPWIVGARFARLRHRVSGTCLLACGVALALVRKS
jgi:threonine/homoserine/homoserine lactone efflux protein